jgi:hypothetical protein
MSQHRNDAPASNGGRDEWNHKKWRVFMARADKQEYIKLIKEDIGWLQACTIDCPPQERILQVLQDAIQQYYPERPLSETAAMIAEIINYLELSVGKDNYVLNVLRKTLPNVNKMVQEITLQSQQIEQMKKTIGDADILLETGTQIIDSLQRQLKEAHVELAKYKN